MRGTESGRSWYGAIATGHIPPWFKMLYLAFVAVLVPVYAVEHGLVNFLWFSNLALIGGLIAAWFESRRLAGMMLVAVGLLEMGWIIGFLLGLIPGVASPFGAVDYMFDEEMALAPRLLSLYHLPLPFVLFWLVWRLGYDFRAWRLWILPGWMVLIASFLLTAPERNVNWVLGPGEVQDWMPAWTWLAVVMAGCALTWWLTHLVVMRIMIRFNRVV